MKIKSAIFYTIICISAFAIFSCKTKQKTTNTSDTNNKVKTEKITQLPTKIETANKNTNTKDTSKMTIGTIINMTGLDGCGMLIKLENGKTLEPLNLPEEFKKEDIKIAFTYKLRPEVMSICMKGAIVELLTVKKAE